MKCNESKRLWQNNKKGCVVQDVGKKGVDG